MMRRCFFVGGGRHSVTASVVCAFDSRQTLVVHVVTGAACQQPFQVFTVAVRSEHAAAPGETGLPYCLALTA